MTNPTANVTLPGGLWLDGARHQAVELHPLTGADEAYLLELDPELTLARRVTGLLCRCVARIGPLAPVTTETVRALTVGDREALLLHLRRVTFGHRMPCILDCPECGEKMDLDATVEQFLTPPYAEAGPWYEATFPGNGDELLVRYRVPCGSDQEEAADAARHNHRQPADLLLRRCIEFRSGTAERRLTRDIADRIGRLMSERDPQAELRLNMTCAGCRRPISALLDAATFLFRDLAQRVGELYREVHTLALSYHWAESEIMAMTAAKRQRYLNLLAESLSTRTVG